MLLSLGSIDASSSKSLYDAVKRIDWREHVAPGATLACDCSGGNESIRHTIYGSQLLKDAVCDNLRDATGERPNIRPERPDVLLHLHVEGADGIGLHRFLRRELAPTRLSHRCRPRAAQGKRRSGGAAAFRMAGDSGRRRHPPRSDVRLRHPAH